MELTAAPPKSSQIAQFIKQEIISGRLKPGARLDSIRSFADKFDVGRQVVLSAFNILSNEKFIAKEVGRGTFINSDWTENKSYKIGLWLNKHLISHPAYVELFASLGVAASRTNDNIVLGSADAKMSFTKWIKERKPDGVLLTGLIDDAFIRKVKKEKIPFVVIGNYELEEDVFRIASDISALENAMTAAIKIFNSRNVGIIGGNPSYLISKQLKGCVRNAIEKMGLKYDEKLLHFSIDEDGYAGIKYLLEELETKPDLLYITVQSFFGVAKYYFEKKLSKKSFPRIIFSSVKSKIAYPELVDLVVEIKDTSSGMLGLKMLRDILQDGRAMCRVEYSQWKFEFMNRNET
ncbi:MAG: hypothetical protein A2017_10305 [Lentisphaerae bacterium GWF2_44_16]|nr:MAG: hypothetical protein A2017_10305 [Lentisphaerae bacterium GWF2_44_16]